MMTEGSLDLDNVTVESLTAWTASRAGPWTEEHRATYKAAVAKLTLDERYRALRVGVEALFIPGNRKSDASREHLSPSGRYRLVVTPYTTGEKTWNYTLGEVYRTVGDSGAPCATVMNNYSSFPFLFIEDHNGHDYLFCTEDYQGQVCIELDTGRTMRCFPEAGYNGHGFCWAVMTLLDDNKTLMVDGCYWACPYELKLFDISNLGDPTVEEHWPELDLPPGVDYLSSGDRSAVRADTAAGTIAWTEKTRVLRRTGEYETDLEHQSSTLAHKVHEMEVRKNKDGKALAEVAKRSFEMQYPELNEDTEDREPGAPSPWDLVDQQRIILRREEGSTSVTLVEHWRSPRVIAAEVRYAEWSAKRKLEEAAWIAESELAQHLLALAPDARIGFMTPSMMSRWEGEPNEHFFSVYLPWKTDSRSSSVQWGLAEGEVKLERWTYGKGNTAEMFPRTMAGLDAALAQAREHAGSAAGASASVVSDG